MKKIFFKTTTAAAVAIALLLGSCNNEAAKTAETKPMDSFSLDSVKNAINASNLAYGAAFAKMDSTAFLNCYTSDACINPSNMPRMCGADALKAFFLQGCKMGIRNIKYTTEEVLGGKDAVAEIGKYELIGDKDMSLDKGKYIVIWKQENGKWKMYKDEWNSDMPMAKQ